MHHTKSSPDYVFLGLVGILVVFGLVVLSSASSVFSFEKFGSSFYLIRHQILNGLLPGLALFVVTMRMPYNSWRRFAAIMFVATILLLLFVLIPGIGRTFGGARSWFTIGSFSFQPPELVKFTFLIYLAAWFEKRREKVVDLKEGFLPFLLFLGIVALIILAQPDVGTMLIVAASAIVLFMSVGARWSHIAALAIGGLLVITLLIKVAPYRLARLTAFVHPELDPQGVGYQVNQSILGIGSGGWLGVGFGHSRQKFRYLPEVTGDSIFAIMAEEMGFIVSAAFIILLLAVLWRMFLIAVQARDDFAKYLTIGIAGWFGIQSFVNIGSMIGILPLTGLPLPFISYGGSALAVELAAVGIVGSISRHSE